MTWDASGSSLFAATFILRFDGSYGGVAVLSFSGSAVTETVYPKGEPVIRVLRDGSFVYGKVASLKEIRPGVEGFDFQAGQLVPLPGSPWQSYGIYNFNDIATY